MKKVLIGLLALGAVSAYATEIIKVHSADIISISTRGEVRAKIIGADGNYLKETTLKGLDKECLEMATKVFVNTSSRLSLEISVEDEFKVEGGVVWAPIFGSNQETCKLKSPFVKL